MKTTMYLGLVLLFVTSIQAAESKNARGYTGLYMGHSFFWPSAQQLERVVRGTSLVNHKQFLVKAGGKKGSARQLWENEKTRVEGQRQLNTKKIDLLVLTQHSRENSSIEHYSRWFDYAITQNPDITFMVTAAWAGHLYKADKELRENYIRGASWIHETLIVELRKKYPDNTILYCPYGLGTYELVDRFNEGKLPGIKYLLNPDSETRKESREKNEQLLNDPLGHPGELVAKLGALLWLKTLYDYDLSALKPQRVRELPDIDLNEIADTVSRKIEQYNARPQVQLNGGKDED